MATRLTQSCSPLSVDSSANLLDGAMMAPFPTAINAMGNQTWALVGAAATLPRWTVISGHNSSLSFMKGSSHSDWAIYVFRNSQEYVLSRKTMPLLRF